jgi:hypothetical protein
MLVKIQTLKPSSGKLFCTKYLYAMRLRMLIAQETRNALANQKAGSF